MRPQLKLTFLALGFAVSTAQAASCRSFDAAQAGAAAGLARDHAAAAAAASVGESSSDILGKCITGITSINLVPAFPSLQDIFQAAIDKVCREASDKIAGAAGALPKTLPLIDPLPALPVAAPVPVAPVAAPATLTARAADFWRALWR